MKNYLLLIMLFLSVTLVFAQEAPNIIWTEFYGGEYSDGFDSIIETSNGNFLMSGYTKLTNSGWYNIYLVQTNYDGIVEWEQSYSFNRHTRAIQIIEISDGGYLLLVEVDNQNETWLMKVDSLGNELWTQEFIGYKWPKSVVETDNNEFMLIGDLHNSDSQPFWALRVDNAGEIIWTQLYYPSTAGLDLTNLTSLINDENSDGYLISGNDPISGNNSFEPFLMKISNIGEIEWDYRYDDTNYTNRAGNIVQDEDDFLLWVYGADNQWIIRVDENGTSVNATTIDVPYNFLTYNEFFVTQNHEYIFLGNAFFPESTNPGFTLHQTNELGELTWNGHYNLTTYEKPSSLLLRNSNEIYVVGIGQVDEPFTTDAYLTKLQIVNSPIIDDLISDKLFIINNFPNPFNPTTTIEFALQNDCKINLSIYNIKGQKVKILTKNSFQKGSHSVIWNGDDESGKSVSSGVYYYKLNINGKTEAVKKCLLLK